MQNQLAVGLDKMQEAAESAHEMGKILAVQAKDVDKAKGEANIVKEKVQHSVKEAEKVAVKVETIKQVFSGDYWLYFGIAATEYERHFLIAIC